MSCPYFYPVERLDRKSWTQPPRLPLGDPFSGACRANRSEPFDPDLATLREFCNFGYARTRCPRFPRAAGPDAVRFSVAADDSGRIRIHYVIEQEHAPLEHGTLDYAPDTDAFAEPPRGELLAAQTRAYIRSYLRRKQQPQNEARNPHRR